MKTPESLEVLVDHGIIQEVVRPLKSGKEAQIYVVLAEGEEYVAKVYKEASQRTFKHRVAYTEGRRTRNSRDQRAVSKRTRHGRKQDEAAWRSTEVDMIYRLRDAGVRVPRPINFVDGVLVMELVKGAQGEPAPRLGDLSFEAKEAREIYASLIREVVRMLCAGVIHGDLSEFNVLMGVDGPVLIDFPQSVDPAKNQSARKLLLRDVENLHRFLARFAPGQRRQPLGEEMWSLYESNHLLPDTQLRGNYRAPQGQANTEEVLALIDDANLEEQSRRGRRAADAPLKPERAAKPMREVVDFTKGARSRPSAGKRRPAERGTRPDHPRARAADAPSSAKTAAGNGGVATKKRRRRRRRKSSPETGADASARASRGEAATAVKSVGPGESNRPKRRRRRRRSSARTRSDESKGGAEGSAKRPSKPGTGRRPSS